MSMLALVLIGLVALLHLYFLVLEMFLWTKPKGRRVFVLSSEQAAQTRVLAATQGLYTGFLAAGPIWGIRPGAQGEAIRLFFLICVLIAGIYGGFTAHRKIFFVQALPAALGIAATLLA